MDKRESASGHSRISVFEEGEQPSRLLHPLFDVLRHHFEISAGYSAGHKTVDEPDNEMILGIGLSLIRRATTMPIYRFDEESMRANFENDLRLALDMNDQSDWRALKAIKKSIKEQTRPLGLVAVALLAAEHMPESGYTGRKVPKPSKGRETLTHKIYRTSIGFLKEFASGERIKQEQRKELAQVAIDGTFDEVVVADSPFGERVRRAGPELTSFLMARDILTTFKVHTPQQIQNDLDKTYRKLMKRFKFRIPMDETGWEILPIGELDGPGSADLSEEESQLQIKYNFIDWTRIETLKQYVRNWPDAYMAVASLESQGDTEYYVAVLPAMIGKLAVEHAIGDNPSSGNAVYAWRAEKGIENERVAMTWRGVYKQTKRIARMLGARRMLHTENIAQNILDYITRPADDLDKPGYKI